MNPPRASRCRGSRRRVPGRSEIVSTRISPSAANVELLPELETLVAGAICTVNACGASSCSRPHRAGRQADVLAAYQATRQVLVDELGLEPGRELREMEAAILVHEPALAPVSSSRRSRPRTSCCVLVAIDGAAPDDTVVDTIVEAGRHSPRRAAASLAAGARSRADESAVEHASKWQLRHTSSSPASAV